MAADTSVLDWMSDGLGPGGVNRFCLASSPGGTEALRTNSDDEVEDERGEGKV